MRLLAAVESHQLPPELNRGNARSALIDKRDKLLVLLHYYRDSYEHPDHVPTQMQQFVGSVPGLAGEVGHWPLDKRRPRLVCREEREALGLMGRELLRGRSTKSRESLASARKLMIGHVSPDTGCRLIGR